MRYYPFKTYFLYIFLNLRAHAGSRLPNQPNLPPTAIPRTTNPSKTCQATTIIISRNLILFPSKESLDNAPRSTLSLSPLPRIKSPLSLSLPFVLQNKHKREPPARELVEKIPAAAASPKTKSKQASKPVYVRPASGRTPPRLESSGYRLCCCWRGRRGRESEREKETERESGGSRDFRREEVGERERSGERDELAKEIEILSLSLAWLSLCVYIYVYTYIYICVYRWICIWMSLFTLLLERVASLFLLSREKRVICVFVLFMHTREDRERKTPRWDGHAYFERARIATSLPHSLSLSSSSSYTLVFTWGTRQIHNIYRLLISEQDLHIDLR